MGMNASPHRGVSLKSPVLSWLTGSGHRALLPARRLTLAHRAGGSRLRPAERRVRPMSSLRPFEPRAQEAELALVLRQREGALVGRARLRGPAQAAQEVGAR